MSETVLTLGGRRFTDRPSPAGLGFSALIGWHATPASKSPITDKPQAHGAFSVDRVYRQGLGISFKAILHPQTEVEFLRMQEQVASIGFDGPVIMQVEDPTGVTERVVTVENVSPALYRGGQARSVLDIDVFARDPRRYSVEDAWVTARPPAPGGGLVWPVVWPAVWAGSAGSDGRVILTNRGTKSSAPIYRIYGGFTSATITNIATQQQVGFELPVPGGSFVELDFSKRTALLDGVSDVTRYITNRSWWDIPAESSVPAQIAISGSSVDPYLAGKVRSAW